MARKVTRKTTKAAAPKAAGKASAKSSIPVDEGSLTKGQQRKLNALRKSVGDDIGARAFADWLAKQSVEASPPADKNAERIAAALKALIDAKQLAIPRGGYLVTRGRGRVVVTRGRGA